MIPQRLQIPWSNYTHFRSARRDLSFEPNVVALSVTVTKFRHYRPGAQQILG